MIELPNPFSNPVAPVSQAATDTAGALPKPPCASAGQSTASEGRSNESPAADALNPHETAGTFDPDADDCIREIFIGALKLNRRFVLDEDRFMADIEEMPLFLRQA